MDSIGRIARVFALALAVAAICSTTAFAKPKGGGPGSGSDCWHCDYTILYISHKTLARCEKPESGNGELKTCVVKQYLGGAQVCDGDACAKKKDVVFSDVTLSPT